MFTASRPTTGRLGLGLVLAAPALLVAACGGTSGSTGPQGASTTAAGSSSQAAKVETHSGDLGTFLTDASGRTLYLFAADHGATSTCTGACASAWPPFTTTGTPVASGQAKAGMLGTISRAGGSRQVTYAGHPLYYFAGDTSSGQTTGQGSNGFGAKWWVVSPAGTAVTHAPGAGSMPSGGSSSSGGSGSGGGGAWG
jgi:predicted lipoprotein with Yx(FWY)xxD motif